MRAAVLCVALAAAGAAGDDPVLNVNNGGDVTTLCAKCNEYWGVLPIGESHAVSRRVVWAEPATGGCVNGSEAFVTNAGSLRGAAVIFSRGPCAFSAMVRAAAAAEAAAVLVVNAANRTEVVPGAGNASDYDDFSGPVCMVGAGAAGALTAGAAPLLAAVFFPVYPVLDPACAVFVVIAVGVLVGGSAWNTHAERARAARCRAGRGDGAARDEDDDGGAGRERGEDQALLTRSTVVFFIVFASVFLTLLYFFYRYLIYVLLFGFGLFGALSVYEHVAAALHSTRLWRYTVDLPRMPATPVASVFAAAVALAVSVSWACTRGDEWNWVFQDFLGVAILVTMIRVVTIPNLKIATILLACLLLYDVFFVFLTPYLTPDGRSVMVNAATGNQTHVDANGCESYTNMMPFLLRVPALARPPCSCPHYSMLGFGDVALPGFAVALTLRADYALTIGGRRARTFAGRHSYFITALVAYVVGLLAAFVAASQMAMAQPALLYLSPAVLGAVWLPGWCRGDLALLCDLERHLGYGGEGAGRSRSRGSSDGDDATDRLLGDTDDSEIDAEA